MELLPKYREMLTFIDARVDEFASASCQRSIVAAALFDVASEHANAICTCFENKHYASGFALERVLFETFTRATWLLHCATDKEFDNFTTKDKIELESKEPFNFGDMLNDVELARDWPKTLSEIKNKAWKAFNSYTHGGQMQVTRRYDGNTIKPHYAPEQIDEAIRFSALIALLTFGEIADFSRSEQLNYSVEQLHNQIRDWFIPSL